MWKPIRIRKSVEPSFQVYEVDLADVKTYSQFRVYIHPQDALLAENSHDFVKDRIRDVARGNDVDMDELEVMLGELH